jgi:mono/diheme cytochrome c family protein
MNFSAVHAPFQIASLAIAVNLPMVFAAGPDGAALYRGRCASCHENGAHGTGFHPFPINDAGKHCSLARFRIHENRGRWVER